MSKRDDLLKGLGNVRESMGEGLVRDAPTAGPRAIPAKLVGVTRSKDASQIAVDRIVRDPSQPREEFDQEALEHLAQSLRTRGQLQPIRVRWDEGQGAYVVIMGERRWRAAKMAGLESLACVVHEGDLNDGDKLAIQVVENALREDLRPIEQAKAYKTLMADRGWTVRQLASELAVHHAQVVRAVSLLDLPESVQERVEQGDIAPHTAYEVSKIDSPVVQAEVALAIVAQGLTRSEVADVVRAVKAKRPAPAAKPDPVTYEVAEGVSVKIAWKKASPVDVMKALRLAMKQAQAGAGQGEAA